MAHAVFSMYRTVAVGVILVLFIASGRGRKEAALQVGWLGLSSSSLRLKGIMLEGFRGSKTTLCRAFGLY